MCFFQFFANLHFVGGVLVPFFTDWGGINLTQIMVLQSWFMLWIFVLEVPSGAVADYLGRKHALVLACIVNIIAALVYGSVPNFFVFLLGEVLWAISAALLSGASEAFIYDTLRSTGEAEKSKKVFGRFNSFGLAGVMVGAPVGSVIAVKLSLNAPMLLVVIPLALAFIIASTFKEPKATQKIESKQYTRILKDGLECFYKNGILKILALDMIFVASIAYFMIWFYQPMLKQAGVDVTYFGVVHASFVVSQILIMNNYEKLETAFASKKRLISLSAFITGVMFIIGGLTSSVPIVLLVIILGGGFGLSRRPLFVSYMNKYIPSSERATVLSAISMIRRFALVVVNPVVGLMADWSLNYTLIVLGILGVIFSLVSRVKEEHLID
jgi:MFS family permease